MMERLTFVKDSKYWNEGRHPTKYTSRKTFQEVVDRLAYYEDMEEQGRLVVLENAEHRNAVMKFYDRLKTHGDWMVQALKGGAN